MAKKKRELVGAERDEVRGGVRGRRGIPSGSATEMFDLIEPFADYGFTAAHACAYG